ncbi:40S ribosomal protein S14 [Spraguea lophii 42_110]|uniref:Small ribosomal subunit protein uS11 n=1 Tax=Spraguea lophii (strain 42_110) TaxID=1358809 RepID=S7W6I0_SPRLO|nr:Chain SO0, 40S ribosomal protein S14 [Spraguea lophii 42_110]7QJH_RO0 Chain RO0, 40S ribosomal protein S14 [Spraguea lophii 42_110]7QJH_SO0 Chain SO0, 40S ribosomal protein S14 [Spraguea lophii 42_110]8BR3_SO0 Chain SO0, 40S ribosomal protein S14 [Spraguea lophii 42_110]8P5D_SO0 Chain SO0, 40S ribosomal protein S14 [Spraguea lophii 42_110]8P60_RO0 Chain RO0, 40S ribosomal protein S14 [Spraguea lophii 42_110]8P60_SO0 Chain SO0, 40S ribosomal protein S14 [Spraguea lophii 42_110]EPR78391.1 4
MSEPMVEQRLNFALLFIKATKNDTIIHATDLTGAETLAKSSGGSKVKAHRDERDPYAAMLATQDVAAVLKEKGYNAVHIKIRGKGGNQSKIIGPGGSTVIRTMMRSEFKLGRVEDVTPVATDSTRKKGGRRGRRL